MSRTPLTVLPTMRAGLSMTANLTAVTAANDAVCINDGATLFLIHNASGSTANLIFETGAVITSDNLAIADFTATQATATDFIYGPFAAGYYNQPSGADVGCIYIDTDQAISIMAFKMGSSS